jgi:predicted Rossmann fold flavoprotein
MNNSNSFQTVIIGAGAAGLMCAAHSGPGTLLIDHAKAPGEKIRISGGGRCNFTNLDTKPENFLSENPHFAKSALSRYTQWDFIALVDRYQIPWHEKTLGQLFCDHSAKDIIAMLRAEMAPAQLWLHTSIDAIRSTADGFAIGLIRDGHPLTVHAKNLVIACGGKSIPKMGATGLGYQIAQQFGHQLTETRPALVPLTLNEATLEAFKPMAGLSADVAVHCNHAQFEEAMLITHRGLSGPAILQISSFWREGEALSIRLCPELNLFDQLRARRDKVGAKALGTILAELIPKRLIQHLLPEATLAGNLADCSDATLQSVVDVLSNWQVVPTSSEGYRTAEVTLGGVATNQISSKTMQSQLQPGLYLIGEVLDVTGWLGGYNFQWAWSSGWAAGQAIAAQQ